MPPEFWPAMDNSMPDCGRRRQFGFDEKPANVNDCFPLVGNGSRLGEHRVAARVFRMAFAAFVADRLGLAREQPFHPRRSNAIQAEFERGRTAVERQYIRPRL